MRLAMVAATLCLVATAAEATTVGEFLARWQRIQSLGQMAQLDPDLRRLADEVGTTVKAYRGAVEQSAAAGKPRSCPPPAGEAKFDSDGLVAYLQALPPARQDGALEDAIYAYLDESYPCPAIPSSPSGSAAAGKAAARS